MLNRCKFGWKLLRAFTVWVGAFLPAIGLAQAQSGTTALTLIVPETLAWERPFKGSVYRGENRDLGRRIPTAWKSDVDAVLKPTNRPEEFWAMVVSANHGRRDTAVALIHRMLELVAAR